MSKFRDSKNREWVLTLTVGMVEAVKADADVDLDELLAKPEVLAGVLTASPRKFGQLLWVMVADQATLAGVTPREFGLGLDRDAIDRAANALIEECVLFYPRRSAGRAIADRLPELLARMDEQIRTETATAMARELSGTPTASPESSGSIPAG